MNLVVQAIAGMARSYGSGGVLQERAMPAKPVSPGPAAIAVVMLE